MRIILADTGPLYALVDPSDGQHKRAHTELERLRSERFLPATAWPTLMESYTLILYRLGVKRAQSWLEEATEGLDLLNPTREHYLDATLRLRRYPDQDISLFDAVLAALSIELQVPVWAFDHHFDVMGARVWR
jgi:predicted nucleic acid-binding protein